LFLTSFATIEARLRIKVTFTEDVGV